MFVCVLVTQSCLTLCAPMDCSPSGSSVHQFPRQEYWSGSPFHSSRNLLDPGIKPRSPALQADSLPSKPPGKTSIIFCEIFPKFIQDLLLLLSHSVKSDIFVTPWTPLSMGFSRQEYWSGLPFPTSGDIFNSGIEPKSPASLLH